ncbi:hypothetical protein [Streptomyces sp. URMC 124]|uniref:hypothetical protein n=1 Tax=Streptomyces sp. URMC 124 TaxID=3423405 RepID=UPI003F1DC85E
MGAADTDSETDSAAEQDAGAEQADDAPKPPAGDSNLADESQATPADALGALDEAAEWYGNDALRDGPHYQEELDDQLAARGLDHSEHDKLRLSRTDKLSEEQIREVVGGRDTIKLGEGRMVTKVITPKVKDAYLDNAAKLGE